MGGLYRLVQEAYRHNGGSGARRCHLNVYHRLGKNTEAIADLKVRMSGSVHEFVRGECWKSAGICEHAMEADESPAYGCSFCVYSAQGRGNGEFPCPALCAA